MKIKKLLTLLREVIAYSWLDELRSWEECGEPKEGHMYHVLKEIKKFITYLNEPGYVIIRVKTKQWDRFMDNLPDDSLTPLQNADVEYLK